MAILYGAKLFESTSLTRGISHTVLSTVKEGALICIALAGKRSGAYLNVASIIDSKGNVYEWEVAASEYRMTGVAWTQTKAAMTVGDTIKITWNGTPSYAWKSAHTFEGADASESEKDHAYGASSTAAITLDVDGSDWLTFASVMAPYADGPTLTPLNSSTSRDSNGASSRPYTECFSRNGTTGTTHTIGASGIPGGSWSITGVSFPFQAMPSTTTTTLLGGFIGI